MNDLRPLIVHGFLVVNEVEYVGQERGDDDLYRPTERLHAPPVRVWPADIVKISTRWGWDGPRTVLHMRGSLKPVVCRQTIDDVCAAIQEARGPGTPAPSGPTALDMKSL